MVSEGPAVSGRWFAFFLVAVLLTNVGAVMAIRSKGSDLEAPFTWTLYAGMVLVYAALVAPFYSAVVSGGKAHEITTGTGRGMSRYATVCEKYLRDHKGKLPAHHSFMAARTTT